MSKTIESISGCLRVALTVMGGMTVTLAPVCATDIQGNYVYLLDKDGNDLLDNEYNRLKTIR